MSQQVRTLQISDTTRIESGAVEFQYGDGDTDWPGLFLRGDDAFGLAMNIHTVMAFFKEYQKNAPLPGELFLALKSIASLADEIHEDVVVGGKSPGLSQKLSDQQIDRKIAEAGV